MVHHTLAADPGAALDPRTPLSAPFRDAVSASIGAFLDDQAGVLAEMGPGFDVVQRIGRDLLTGGKRLRPAFCVWSYVAVAGVPGPDRLGALLSAAASLELLHVSALVHDDVMDSSDLRRGRPAAHRQLEAMHAGAGWRGDPAAFGRAGAVLLGDLLLMWSAELLRRSGVGHAALDRALPVAEAMRTEVTCGQYLDIVGQARPWTDGTELPAAATALEEANRVVEYKAARYTVQRPCQMGAAIAGGDRRLHDALAGYGSPLGRAFQFRDDLLGVFGDTRVTGKPAGDDLREGKRTVLVAHAYAHSGPAGRALLADRLGDPELDPDGVARLREVIVDSGAREAVERMIADGHARALAALREVEISEPGRIALTVLADAAVNREF